MLASRDMVRMGVSSSLTTGLMLDALSQNYDAASMATLRRPLDAQKIRTT